MALLCSVFWDNRRLILLLLAFVLPFHEHTTMEHDVPRLIRSPLTSRFHALPSLWSLVLLNFPSLEAAWCSQGVAYGALSGWEQGFAWDGEAASWLGGELITINVVSHRLRKSSMKERTLVSS